MNKPYSQACENNKAFILDVLRTAFADRRHALEIGSGTGQHAVYFAEHLPHLVWQPTDVVEHLPGIHLWREEAGLDNLLEPVVFDVNSRRWPDTLADAVYSANTLHIMSWPEVQISFELLGQFLPVDARLCIYGPFNYNGHYTSDSNAQFNQWLKMRDPDSGIRDFEKVDELALAQGFELQDDHAMPANNRLLHWIKR